MFSPKRQIYRFNEVEVDLSRSCLLLGGEEKHLRQKAFQVLVCLLERRERLVSKNELFEIVWKDTAVTDDVLVQCVTEIRRSIGDDPHHPRFIKTVPKSGYRFIGAVEEHSNGSYTEEITRVEFEFEEETDTIQKSDANPVMIGEPARRTIWSLKSINRYSIAAATVFVCALAAMFYFGWRSNSLAADGRLPQTDGRKTVAVMFFENQSNSAEFDWLREGLADMLAAGLSRSGKLSLLDRGQLSDRIGRTSANSGPIASQDALEIARQSRADVFILGNFAQIGEHVRVDVHLYDGHSGALLSTESLTVERAEQLLTEVDLLSLKIANRLNAGPEEKREFASVMTDNLEAYRCYSLAVEKAHGYQNQAAIDLLERAVALDPEFAMAHARIGYAYAVTWSQMDRGKPYLEKAFKLSSKLTEKDRLNIAAWYAIANLDFLSAIDSYREIINRFPLETEAYWRLARLLGGEGKREEAIAVLKEGMLVDPQSRDIFNNLGILLSGLGRHGEAISAHERFVALAPNEPNSYDSLGLSYQWSGNYDQAIANFEAALRIDPKFEIALIHLANARIRLGQYGSAIELIHRYISEAPSSLEKARGYDCLGFLYLRKGRLDLAEQAASNARSANPAMVWDSYFIAVRRGRHAKSTVFEKTLFAPPKVGDRGTRPNPRFELYRRGMVAMLDKRGDEAIGHFRELIGSAPPTWNFVDFEDSLGVAFLDLGRYDDAIAEFERILRIAPNYPLAHFHLAEAYSGKGLTGEALQNYRRFLEDWQDADPDLPEMIQAGKRTSGQ